MEPVPLGAEDKAILALESATVAGHTCKVVLVGPGSPDLATLRRAVAKRIADAPALTRRLGGTAAAPAWVPDDTFDVAQHIEELPTGAPLDRLALCAAVAELFTQRLDRSRPLWKIDVVPVEGGRSALVWRLHHALADGTAAMRHAKAVLWDPLVDADPPHVAHARHERDEHRRRSSLAAFLRREAPHPTARSPFAGRIGPEREIAFARVPMGDLHDAVKQLAGATVNDGVLTLIAGALRRWAEHRDGRLANVRVKVPVSLHTDGDDEGNRDSFFTLPLPLREPDPVERLRIVHTETKAAKEAHDARRMDELQQELEHVSPRLRKLLTHVEDGPAAFALSVSNVPGPRSHVSVLGAPVEELHSIAEIGERHALRVAVVSLAGEQLGFGFCADPAIVGDLDLLADGVEAEAAALVQAAAA